MIRILTTVTLLFFVFCGAASAETVQFTASDGVIITAETGGKNKAPNIVLFHMAGASRGEYRDIAPRLQKLGYSTLAVDQRSGGKFNGVHNETVKRLDKNASYAAAIPDIIAAGKYARETMKTKQVAILGSSYSSSLVLVVVGQNTGFADAVLSFSPGEYFSDKRLVSKSAANIKVPVFLTAARSEMGKVKSLAKNIVSPKVVFTPNGAGRHGAPALISKDGAEYWAAVEAFLVQHFPAR